MRAEKHLIVIERKGERAMLTEDCVAFRRGLAARHGQLQVHGTLFGLQWRLCCHLQRIDHFQRTEMKTEKGLKNERCATRPRRTLTNNDANLVIQSKEDLRFAMDLKPEIG